MCGRGGAAEASRATENSATAATNTAHALRIVRRFRIPAIASFIASPFGNARWRIPDRRRIGPSKSSEYDRATRYEETSHVREPTYSARDRGGRSRFPGARGERLRNHPTDARPLFRRHRALG